MGAERLTAQETPDEAVPETEEAAAVRVSDIGIGIGTLIGLTSEKVVTPNLLVDIHVNIAFNELLGLRVSFKTSAPFQAQAEFVRLRDIVLAGAVGVLFRHPFGELAAIYAAITAHLAYAPITDQTALFLLGSFGGFEGGITDSVWLYAEIGGQTEFNTNHSEYPYATGLFVRAGTRVKL